MDRTEAKWAPSSNGRTVEPGSGLSVKPAAEFDAEAAPPRQTAREYWWMCLAIAFSFAAWALRTIGSYNVIETDAARHVMNGVFLRDLIVRGTFTDVLSFARAYYAHLPALSLPYHPPLFPF